MIYEYTILMNLGLDSDSWKRVCLAAMGLNGP